MFDHGPGAHHRLLEAGRKAVEVTDAFFAPALRPLHRLPAAGAAAVGHGAGRIPDLNVVGPPPIARMTSLLFGEDGVLDRTSPPALGTRVASMSSGPAEANFLAVAPTRACGKCNPAR